MPIPDLRSKNVQLNQTPSGTPGTGNMRLGERIVFTDDMSLKSNPGTVVGEHSGFCTLVRQTAGADTYQCEATFRLLDGEITVATLIVLPRPNGQTISVPISGGSGKYRNIRGQIKVTKIN